MKQLYFIIFCSLSLALSAQESPSVSSKEYSQKSLKSIFDDFHQETKYPFFYQLDHIEGQTFSGKVEAGSLESALKEVLSGTDINSFIYDSAVYVAKDLRIIQYPKIGQSFKSLSGGEIEEVEKGLLFSQEYMIENSSSSEEDFVFEIGNRTDLVPGGSSTVAGYVTVKETGEPLIGALVYMMDPMIASSTDADGFYSLKLPNGKHTLLVQYSGMKNTRRNVVLFADGRLDIAMETDVIALQEVTIESERDANIASVQMGVNRLDVESAKNVPAVLGERDIVKIATTFAGIQSSGEGASGFNVRGGKSDQNLFLLNGSPIYNTSHFLGFFSVFNADAIDNMEIYKSGIPAKFGGRLSSVFDITSKKASKTEFHGVGGISPVTSKLTLEVPIFKEKSGLMVSGRTTYSNWVLNNVGNADYKDNKVSFYDILARYDHDISAKDELSLSMYFSEDNFRLAADTLFSFSNFSYTNKNLSGQWKHTFSEKVDMNISAVYSNYSYEVEYTESLPNAFVQDFEIGETSVKAEAGYYLDDINTFTAGLEVKNYEINPGSKSREGELSLIEEQFIDHEYGREMAVYLNDEYIVNDKLSLSGGVRYSMFASLGESTIYAYDPDKPKSLESIIDSTYYGDGETSSFCSGPEFRVSGRYLLDKVTSIKASYGRTRQYIHTLSNSASLSPTDTWRISNEHLLPQIADQYSVGVFRNFWANKVETSLEGYYKHLQNLVDFKTGADFLLNSNVETAILQGPGKSYGVEFSVKKSGRLNGWFNYSYARTLIQLEGAFKEETINNGAYYPASYDMPHTINIVSNYKLTKRLSVSYNLVYNSGKPVTYPIARYNLKGIEVVDYSDRNGYRIPDYLRMDIGISLEAGHKLSRLAHSDVTFSVYNVLGRDNPYSVYFDLVNGEVRGYKLVVFGKPIPTVSYNFKF